MECRLIVGAMPVQVRWLAGEQFNEEHSHRPDHAAVVGYFFESTNRIHLRTDTDGEVIDPQRVAETALHEALHAVWAQCGLGSKHEEAHISALAPALFELIRRNPWFVAYLLDPTGVEQ